MRPRRTRNVAFQPQATSFTPSIETEQEVTLKVDELEALRLKDLLGLDQKTAAQKMNISQPTFHRLILSARNKMADALVNAKELRILGGNFKISGVQKQAFRCLSCIYDWEMQTGTGSSLKCPSCESKDIKRKD